MNAEMVERLGRSFDRERILDQAIDWVYGPRAAVLLAVIGRAMNEIGRHAFPADWMKRPEIFDEVAAAVGEIFDAFRPDGAGPPHPILVAGIVRPLLAAIKDPDRSHGAIAGLIGIADTKWADDLRDWAKPLRKKLGSAASARLRIHAGPAEHMRYIRHSR
jgi:hypothetical protein